MWPIVIILLLCGGTLFFSVNNLALRTFSRPRLQEAFKAVGGELTDNFVEKSEQLTLACAACRLVCNVVILLLLVAIMPYWQQPAGYAHYFVAFAVAGAIFSVFSLAIPHAWAKYAGEEILARTHRVLGVVYYLTWPLLYVFSLYDGLIRRLVGVAEPDEAQDTREKQEEFLTDLAQHRLEGIVDAEEQEMIENVLELSDAAVHEIMTPRTDVVAIDSSCALPAILDVISTAGHSRLPVYEDSIDDIVGLLYAKDLLAEIGRQPGEFRLADRMRPAYFVPETKPIRDLLHEFQNQKLHIAVVLDEYGGTAGIVTIEDILEELVGEITDEYEKTPPKPIRRIDADTLELDARTHIDVINDELELNLPEDEDYETVGGFVFSHLGYIPKTGSSFEYGNLKFTITGAEPRRIRKIRIQKMPAAQP